MYKYTVYFWDNINDKPNTEEGLTSGENYEVAVHKISDYYGDKNILNIELEVMEDPLVEEDIKHIFAGE